MKNCVSMLLYASMHNSCKYLAHHELESIVDTFINITININTIIVIIIVTTIILIIISQVIYEATG